jgi:ABC-type uncharacterized transport system substrate-binding protein
MGRIQQGANGGFSGKAGSVIGYRSRGKDFIRGLPQPSTKKPSQAQLVSRAKFAVLQKWRAKYQDIFSRTFINHIQERSAQNAAHRFNTQIIVGEYPNFEIDWTAVAISQGSLPQVTALQMTVDAGVLNFSWDPQTPKGTQGDDLVTVVVVYDRTYFYDANFAVEERHKGKCSFQLNGQNHKTADVYFTVLSNDRKNAANSVYLGEISL